MTNKVEFDGVFKMSGVWASVKCGEKSCCWIQIKEQDEGICLSVPDYYAPVMTVAAARSLAAQIMEAARRHEVRHANG